MHAAIGAYSSCSTVRKYHAKFKKRRPALVARTIVAKEIANIVWHVLSKNEPYKGFKGTETEKSPSKYYGHWPRPVSPYSDTGLC